MVRQKIGAEKMRFWFFVMTFMSVAVFGNQSDEEHYRQIVEDFSNGHVPTLEQLAEVPWRTGRCVLKENTSELAGTILGVVDINHGPYYSNRSSYIAYVGPGGRTSFDVIDTVSVSEIREAMHQFIGANVILTRTSVLLSGRSAGNNLYLRFFNDTLLVSMGGEEDSKRVGMCYYFREVTE